MLSLNEYVRLDELEKDLFHIGKLDSKFFWENDITIKGAEDAEILKKQKYNEYQKIIYKDLIIESLTKTYDAQKLKQSLNDKFDTRIDEIVNYNKINPGTKYNKRFYVKGDKKTLNSKEFQSILDLYGFMICQQNDLKYEENKKYCLIEPIYFNDVSSKINHSNILWHVIPVTSDHHTLDNIKKSFRDKGGLKPSKREKISKHFRRVYCWKEDVKTETIWQFLIKNEGFNGNFILVQINWRDYIDEFHRKVEWFEDPNSEGIWTREIIPYQYLKFYELNSKQELENILNYKEK